MQLHLHLHLQLQLHLHLQQLEQQQSSVKRQKCSFALAIERRPKRCAKRSETTHIHPLKPPTTHHARSKDLLLGPAIGKCKWVMGKKRLDDHVDGGCWVDGGGPGWTVGWGRRKTHFKSKSGTPLIWRGETAAGVRLSTWA